jgi:ketosteroid isomerase-like protein
MTTKIDTSVSEFLSRWTRAELDGNSGAMNDLLVDDFIGVGPLGFLLSKQAWRDRFGPQGLHYDGFQLEDVQARTYGDAAIVTAREVVRGTHAGNPIPQEIRASLVLVRQAGSWRLATVHISFIAGTPGSPPLPEPPR